MSTLHDNISKPISVDGDIRQHARQLLQQASMRRQPGRSSFDVAIAVAEITMDDFMKNGAVLESAFVRDVRDELLLMRDEVNGQREAFAEFVALEVAHQEAASEWAAPGPAVDVAPPSPVEEFLVGFDTEVDEDALRRRHWRETYAMLEPLERRVLVGGVAGLGVVAVSIVSALMGVIL